MKSRCDFNFVIKCPSKESRDKIIKSWVAWGMDEHFICDLISYNECLLEVSSHIHGSRKSVLITFLENIVKGDYLFDDFVFVYLSMENAVDYSGYVRCNKSEGYVIDMSLSDLACTWS